MSITLIRSLHCKREQWKKKQKKKKENKGEQSHLYGLKLYRQYGFNMFLKVLVQVKVVLLRIALTVKSRIYFVILFICVYVFEHIII